MKFLHISDTHFLRDYATNQDGFTHAFTQMTPPLSQLEILLQSVEGPIDFVIHSGDLTHGGTLEDFKAFDRAMTALFGNIPILTTPGNHDPLHAYQAVFAKGQSLPLIQVTQFPTLQVIAFQSAASHAPNGVITHDMCQKLLKQLSQTPALPTILVTHHHVLADQLDLPCAQVDPLFQTVMAQPQVIALLTGHTHHHYAALYHEKPYYTADSLSFLVDREQEHLVIYQQSGLHLFSLEQNTLHCQPITTHQDRKKLGLLC